MLASRLALALLLPLLIVTPAAAAEVDVYLLGGQSNMQGIGKVANLPAPLRGLVRHVQFYNGKTFEPLVVGQTRTSNRAGEFGPEVGFALGISSEERPAYLIKHAASGTGLHRNWDGGKWNEEPPTKPRRNFHPGVDADDKAAGRSYLQMIARYQAGLESLRQAGHTPVVRGFVWMQGEQDAKHQASSSEYAQNLAQLRTRLTEDLKLPSEPPMVFGQVLPHTPAMARFTHREQVRQSMANADSRSGHASAMPRASMVSTDSCELLPDTVHYNAAGQLGLGKLFAGAMRELQTRETEPQSQTP